MSRDVSKIKKRMVVELYRNKKEFLNKILGKWWDELKYLRKWDRKFC